MSFLEGKVAVITGAGRGVGRAHARLFAREGARVVVNDLGTELEGSGASKQPAQEVVEAIRSDGGDAVAHYGDVADMDDARTLIETALDTYGRLDALVCNAGVLRDRMSFNMTEEEWDTVIRVHLKGHFAPVRHAGAHWRSEYKETGEPQNAAIVLTSSASGYFGNPGQLNYAAAKSGIATMAVVLARELARYGVRANAVAPTARTRMTEDLFDPPEEDDWDPLAPENNSGLVAYLCSDAADDISGQAFLVQGDTLHWMRNWQPQSTLDRDGPWTLRRIHEHRDELFGNEDTTPGSRPV